MSRGNIIGEGFAEEIKKQVETRQKAYGAANRTDAQLKYFNAREPWIKLTSSVNVDNAVLNKVVIPETYAGSSLAKGFVLFGGSSLESGTALRKGFGEVYNILDSAGDFGYRPMPGIISLDSKNRNRGSVRETTIQLKAYTPTQFNMIDLLYLRIGYTILLEWGHTLYLDNEGNTKEFTANDTLSSTFLEGVSDGKELDQKSVMDLIKSNKMKFVGNYDAIYGKISNFSWSFETDGSYNITITVMSLGDIIESLKMNLMPTSKTTVEATEKAEKSAAEATTEYDVIFYLRNRDTISNLFYNCQTALFNSTGLSRGTEYSAASTTTEAEAAKLGLQVWDIVGITEETLLNEGRFFIRFGAFLKWLQENQSLYGKNSPIFEIDYNEENNLIFTTPYVLSSDPRISIVKTDIIMSEGNYSIFPSITKDFKLDVEGTTVGKLMNVYINMAFIDKKITETKDENKNISLFSLLEAICGGINSSLGSINKISPVIDEEDNNRIYFLDETPLPNRNTIIKKINPEASIELTSFQIYGYQQNNSSFITNFGIKTEITNELSTTVTVGAQANGAVKGQDSTSLSKFNTGITDRILPIKTTTNPTGSTADTSDNSNNPQLADINTEYENIVSEYSSFINGFADENAIVYDDQVDYFPDILKNFLEYNQAKESLETQKVSPTATGFLPINLNLEMIGLSGMKIYQKFTVNQKFLPANYPEVIEFLIKTISHKVDQKGWYTTLDSLGYPKDDILSKAANPSTTFIQPPVTTTETTTTSAADSTSGGSSAGGGSTIAGQKFGQCYAEKVYNSNPPGYDTDKTIVQSRLDAIKKMSLQSNPFRNNYQVEGTYYCARYTYNHAYNFTQAIKGQPVNTGGVKAGGGDAEQPSYWSNLVKLGYTQYVVGKNISKSEIITLINTIKYNVGDVLAYWNNTGTTYTDRHRHTQFYAGLAKDRKDKEGKAFKWYVNKKPYGGDVGGTTGWCTDNATNYNGNFCYTNKAGECWVLLLFRAPGDVTQLEKSKSLKQYEYLINEIIKVLGRKDNNVYTGGNNGPLLEQFKGFNDDEDGAAKALQQLIGYIGQPSPSPYWYNKLNYKTFITDTAQQQHFITKFKELLNKMQGGSLNDTYTWCYPDLNTNKDTNVCKSINTDF